jgi:hypothetical protein
MRRGIFSTRVRSGRSWRTHLGRAVLIGAMTSLPGCIQPIDGDLASMNGTSPTRPELTRGALPLNDAGLPYVFDADLSQQCAPNSALCYELCGSPSCAELDNSVPIELATPSISLPDGGVTADPCVAISAEARAIRTRSCAQCHGPSSAPPQGGINYILDDQMLLTSKSGSAAMVVAGDPAGSYIYAKMSQGIAGEQIGMPPANPEGLCPAPLVSTIVYPTPQDMSVMYAWILNCVGPDAGNGYGSSYSYGPGYAPGSTLATRTAEGGAGTADANASQTGSGGAGAAEAGATRSDGGRDAGVDAALVADAANRAPRDAAVTIGTSNAGNAPGKDAGDDDGGSGGNDDGGS